MSIRCINKINLLCLCVAGLLVYAARGEGLLAAARETA